MLDGAHGRGYRAVPVPAQQRQPCDASVLFMSVFVALVFNLLVIAIDDVFSIHRIDGPPSHGPQVRQPQRRETHRALGRFTFFPVTHRVPRDAREAKRVTAQRHLPARHRLVQAHLLGKKNTSIELPIRTRIENKIYSPGTRADRLMPSPRVLRRPSRPCGPGPSPRRAGPPSPRPGTESWPGGRALCGRRFVADRGRDDGVAWLRGMTRPGPRDLRARRRGRVRCWRR